MSRFLIWFNRWYYRVAWDRDETRRARNLRDDRRLRNWMEMYRGRNLRDL